MRENTLRSLMPEVAKTVPKQIKRGNSKPQPIVETRRQKFLRLGQPRVVNALHAIRLVGNLASPNYEWEDDDVTLINNTLHEAIEQTIAKFGKQNGTRLEETFKLVASKR